MNILIASIRGPTNTDRRGGAQDYIRFVASPWVERGHRVGVVCGQERYRGELLPKNETVDGIDVERVGEYGERIVPIRRRLKQLSGDADVIIENMMGYPLFLPASGMDVPVIALKHHYEGMAFLRTQGLVKGLLGRVLEEIIQPVVYRGTPFVVVSQGTLNVHNSAWLRPRGETRIIPPGIIQSPLPEGVGRDQDPTIIYYGALDTGRKRIDHLIEAFREVGQELPDAQLIIGGDGPDRQRLETQARGLRVTFTGFLSEADKGELLARGWVFASPSMTEGFGITWIEANAAGLPVVGYNLSLDTVNETCSIMVDLGDVAALVRALNSLLVDDELRSRMGEAGRRNAARFDWRRSSDSFLEFVEEVSSR